MNDPDLIADLEDVYAEVFNDILEDADDSNDAELMESMDAHGELGVAEFTGMSVEQLRKQLMVDLPGMQNSFPFFNEWVSDLGKLPSEIEGFENISGDDVEAAENHPDKLRALQPQWHQLVGLSAIIKRFYSGSNVLLADGVGVGKTMECFMAMAFLRHQRIMQSKNLIVL